MLHATAGTPVQRWQKTFQHNATKYRWRCQDWITSVSLLELRQYQEKQIMLGARS